MTFTRNAVETYDELNISIREDLGDLIHIMSPVQTPLLYHLPVGPNAGSTVFEWLTDYIRAPEETLTGSFGSTEALASARAEGATAIFPDEKPRVRMANRTVIVTRAADVSDTQRAVRQAGVDDEFAYAIWQAGVEVAQQFDFNLHWGQADAGAEGGAIADARMTHGVGAWMYYTGADGADANKTWNGGASSTVTIAGYTFPVGDVDNRANMSSTFYDVTASAAMTRSEFVTNLLEPAWRRGMTIDGSVAFCGHSVKRHISEFALAYDADTGAGTDYIPLNHRHIAAEALTSIDTIDVYKGDFGSIYFNLDRHMTSSTSQTMDNGVNSPSSMALTPQDSLFILETDFWKIRMLRPLTYKPLAKVGDGTQGMQVLEGGLECSNPIAGIFAHDFVGN